MVQRVLVTGGSGFIGTNLVEYLVATGARVVNADTAPPRNPAQVPFWSRVDLLDRHELRRVIREFAPDLVFHLGARTDLNGATIADYAANTDGVRNLIDAASGLPNLRRVVFASSMLVCRLGYRPSHDADYNPNTTYGASKAEGEKIVRRHADGQFSWVIVRPTSLWGPWFGVPYRNFFDAIRSGWYVHPSGVVVRRSYGFVLNSVAQLARLAAAPEDEAGRKTFYLADYQPIELHGWAELIRAGFGAPRIRSVPLLLLQAGGLMGDCLRAIGIDRVPLTTFRVRNMTTEAVYDTTSLERTCGAIPYTREDGVRITIEWMKAHDRPLDGDPT
jgi:nucleoside-diphosphate-sugar epimerase